MKTTIDGNVIAKSKDDVNNVEFISQSFMLITTDENSLVLEVQLKV